MSKRAARTFSTLKWRLVPRVDSFVGCFRCVSAFLCMYNREFAHCCIRRSRCLRIYIGCRRNLFCVLTCLPVGARRQVAGTPEQAYDQWIQHVWIQGGAGTKVSNFLEAQLGWQSVRCLIHCRFSICVGTCSPKRLPFYELVFMFYILVVFWLFGFVHGPAAAIYASR